MVTSGLPRPVAASRAVAVGCGFDTGRCSLVDHRLGETWTLADGTIWQYLNLYCGTVTDGNRWSGTGTFTLTAPDGTLTGRSTSAASIPSSGVPYHLDVDDGTGAYAGITGTCTIDEHLHGECFGVQDHAGHLGV